MKRREFFKWSSLAAGGLLAVPRLMAAHRPTPAQEDALDFAVRYAMENGALYADARIGPCELQGHAHPIFQTDLAGFRICTADGWRNAILRDLNRAELKKALDTMLSAKSGGGQTPEWRSAIFDAEKILIRRSSDPDIEKELNAGSSRFAERSPIPVGNSRILFLEILLDH